MRSAPYRSRVSSPERKSVANKEDVRYRMLTYFAAPIPEPKRKPLSQQAGEYPAKGAAPARSNVQGVSLVGAGSGVSAMPMSTLGTSPLPHAVPMPTNQLLTRPRSSSPAASAPRLPASPQRAASPLAAVPRPGTPTAARRRPTRTTVDQPAPLAPGRDPATGARSRPTGTTRRNQLRAVR